VEYAVEFARKNTRWLERQLQRTPPEWKQGTEILFRGIASPIQITPGLGGFRVSFADWDFDVASQSQVRPAIETRVRALATKELIGRTLELAMAHGLEVRSVQVRDQRSRWGSCSVRKTICLNWRLIQTPDFVRDYIIIHELMHLKEMNHSPRFWAHVAAADPRYLDAERWLKKNSRVLR
jgi:predicted metal-dependent hydrolase